MIIVAVVVIVVVVVVVAAAAAAVVVVVVILVRGGGGRREKDTSNFLCYSHVPVKDSRFLLSPHQHLLSFDSTLCYVKTHVFSTLHTNISSALTPHSAIFDANSTFNDGLDGSAPLVFFDRTANALVVSPFNNFMSASMWQEDHAPNLNLGIMGGVDSLPAGFEHKTLVYCSDQGIGHALEGWGEVMRKVYNKTQNVTDYHARQDLSLTHLGYWTDNGAFYYYHQVAGKNYEATLLDIEKNANDLNIPYR
ncbi:non-lysosomal glucosylceramidase [Elysia marginata]|uniref:Non-lysosomal glucosylceramidase n=1 Tax=Elysia marginata TaxID=1093978 RepID=A0AAV4GN41_9GAST|nr:non-lysosomal glucosylceramidase [Elysia marginata]